MKKLLLLPLIMVAFACGKHNKPSDEKIVDTFTIPANKGYAEPFSENETGVSVPVGYLEDIGAVSQWVDASKSVVWYLYQHKGRYDMFFDAQVEADAKLKFDLFISQCQDSSFVKFQRTVELQGSDTLFAAYVEIPATGYYRYELKPITPPDNRITIKSLIFNSFEENGQVNQTEYQSSPSVHLSFSSTAPTTKSYDWIYQEIMVPEGGDPLATYYMSLGFFRGYMGIQTNSATERRVLFSVWDSKDADTDATMTAADFVSLVDRDSLTTVNSFGNEGTGGQSYVTSAGWKTGVPVKFLMNVRPVDGNTTLFSAWYSVSDKEDDWKYVATWRAPHESRTFDGFYSFIENFGFTNGQFPRKAYYYNAWGREDKTGNWINFNKVRFSNTDGRVGERADYEQGVAPEFPDRFYMASGGYTPTLKTANEIPLSTTPPALDINQFSERVDHALSQEAKHRQAVKKEVRGKK